MTLKRLILLVLSIALIAAPIAESAAFSDSPLAGAAKKKGKKCKKGKKGKKSGKKGKKCKKKGGGGSTPGGLPGKPVSPTPTDPPADPDALVLESMTLDENPLLAGTSGTGRVTLSAPAPTGGQAVSLGSEDSARASMPDGVHVAVGQTTATFPIDTTVGSPVSLTLTSAIGTSVRQVELDIVDEADIDAVELDYQCFPDDGLVNFGDNLVRLNVKAPTNTVVTLQSSDPTSLTVPPSVTVPEGSFIGVFTVNTLATTPSVTVTATLDGDDRTDTASVRDINDPPPVASSLTLQPVSVVVGDPSTGRVSLGCEAPAGGITVNLSDDHALVGTPASVVVPAGELSASFPITTDVSGSAGIANITATTGATSVQAPLELRDLGT